MAAFNWLVSGQRHFLYLIKNVFKKEERLLEDETKK